MKIPAILCDGRFHDFKKIRNSDLSTDGSRFLITGFKSASLIDAGPCTVDEKLNKLFDEAAKQGFTHTILIGCDEYPEGDLDLFLHNLERIEQSEPMLFQIQFKDLNKKVEKKFINRIFLMPSLIRAGDSHNTFFSKSAQAKGIQTAMIPNPTCIEGITIHHDNSIRDKERNELMRDYQTKIKEKKF